MFEFLKRKKKGQLAETTKTYTVDELREICLNNFPYDDKYINSRDKVIEIVDEVMGNRISNRYFRNAEDALLGIVYKMFPRPVYNKEDKTEYLAWVEWMYNKFSDWTLKAFYNYWLAVFGFVRTKEEAAAEAADEWCRRIFNNVLQYNGSEDEPQGPSIMMLGSLLKANAQQEITTKTIDTVRKKITDYYMKNGDRLGLMVDYHPCAELHDILKESGVKESQIDSICPWKTRINVNASDNSIYIGTYQSYELR